MGFMEIITRPGVIMLIVLAVFIIYALYFKPVKKDKEENNITTVSKVEATPLDLNDEEATIAALIASIDYYNEIKKDVKVISVRRVG